MFFSENSGFFCKFWRLTKFLGHCCQDCVPPVLRHILRNNSCIVKVFYWSFSYLERNFIKFRQKNSCKLVETAFYVFRDSFSGNFIWKLLFFHHFLTIKVTFSKFNGTAVFGGSSKILVTCPEKLLEENYFFENLLQDCEQNFFWILAQFLAELSKLHSTCPEKSFGKKIDSS